MAGETVRLQELEGGVALVTLNRPEALNAMNRALSFDLVARFREVAAMPGVRAVVLTGAGRAFSAGADLGSARNATPGVRAAAPAVSASGNPMADRLGSMLGNRSSAAIEGLPQVTIGAVNGLAVGGAVAFRLARLAD